MTPEPEFDALAQEWLDGTLDEAGQARLLDILREDATARERLESYAWLHHHVEEALGAETPDLSDRVVQEIEVREGERIRDQVLARVHQPLRIRVKAGPPRRGRVWAVAGIAAAFLVSLTTLLFRTPPAAPVAAAPVDLPSEDPAPRVVEFPERTKRVPASAAAPEADSPTAPPAVPLPKPGPRREVVRKPVEPPVKVAGGPAPTVAAPRETGRVERVKGVAYVVTSSGREPLEAGRTLRSGETLEVAGRSAASVRLADGTFLDLSPDTVLGTWDDIILTRGTVTTRSPSSLTVVTPTAKATLTGARAVLTAEPEATRIKVDEGRLHFVRSADGATCDLGAGFAAVASEQCFLGPVYLAGQDVGRAKARLLDGVQKVDLQSVKEASGQLANLNQGPAVDALLAGLEAAMKVNQTVAEEQRRTYEEIRAMQPSPNVPVSKDARSRHDELSVRYYDLTAKLVLITDIRAAIQEAFGAVTAEVLVKELGEALNNNKTDPNNRAVVAEALGRVKRAEAGAALLKRLARETERLVKVALLDALTARADPSTEIVKAVAEQLADAFPQVVVAAARALGASRSPEAVPVLIEAFKSVTDPRAREELNAALVGLTKTDKHGSYDAWKDWWSRNEEAVRARTYTPPKGELAGEGQVAGGTTFYGLPIKSDKIVFVIDYSNSMSKPARWVPPSNDVASGGPKDPLYGIRCPENPTKVDVARYELKKALATLPDGLKFNIVFFNHEVWTFSPRRMETLGPDVRRRAFEFIDGTGLVLGTDIFESLKAGFGYAGVTGAGMTMSKSDVDTIIFLSDGLPYLRTEVREKGVVDPDKILEQIREWNKRAKVIVHTIQISADSGGGGKKGGDAKGTKFMRSLAEENGGTHVQR